MNKVCIMNFMYIIFYLFQILNIVKMIVISSKLNIFREKN